MMKLLLPFLTLLLFTGCFNERGISLRYYSDCEEYYDLQGYHHKKCGDTIMDYGDVKTVLNPSAKENDPKVW